MRVQRILGLKPPTTRLALERVLRQPHGQICHCGRVQLLNRAQRICTRRRQDIVSVVLSDIIAEAQRDV